ncbi:hypothetical protein SPLC1_S360910 [Arthrospira platensis C1]|nr:hypothetical protein SPLC1_S360910 [Arthrospira platensis C1]
MIEGASADSYSVRIHIAGFGRTLPKSLNGKLTDHKID